MYASILIGKAHTHSSVHHRESKEVYQLKLINYCNDAQSSPEIINRATYGYDALIISFLHIVQPIIFAQFISLIDAITESVSAKTAMTHLSNAYHHRLFSTTLTMSKSSILMASALSLLTKKNLETECQQKIRKKFDTYRKGIFIDESDKSSASQVKSISLM